MSLAKARRMHCEPLGTRRAQREFSEYDDKNFNKHVTLEADTLV